MTVLFKVIWNPFIADGYAFINTFHIIVISLYCNQVIVMLRIFKAQKQVKALVSTGRKMR